MQFQNRVIGKGFQPMPMPNLQDFEGEDFQNFKKKGKIVRKMVSAEIEIYCNNILIILLARLAIIFQFIML